MNSRLIQLISLAFIAFIIIINLKLLIFGDNTYNLAFLIPLSTSNITFLDEFIETESKQNKVYFKSEIYTNRFYFSDSTEIKQLLDDLDNNKCYVVTFQFILSWLQYEEDNPVLVLSKPILISKDSNPSLISNFIWDKSD